MKDIKFRAWYIKEKRMLSWEEINDGTEDFKEYINGFSDVSPLMQYTGLKDKNGVEIYEGDIVKHWIVKDWGKSQVRYIDTHGGYFPFGFHTYAVKKVWNGKGELYMDCEVIGNIYENPELCEVEE